MEKVINILLAEDDQLDVMNIKRALDKMNILYQLNEARNGEEAMGLLQTMAQEGADKLPDFVLLDINMPRMDGLELLATIRKTEQLRHLKVFMITTSVEKVDKDRAKALGVSGYIVKPLRLTNPSSMDAFNLMIDLLNSKN
ncbi:MAG: response regulator [Chitinophagaceae bacterium]|nr:MAG: response regulator [Chitinophagaceae bacterium]